MGSVNNEEINVAKPKIDLLLQEINEVKNRENEYLAHIKAVYPESYLNYYAKDNNSPKEPISNKNTFPTSNEFIVEHDATKKYLNFNKSAKNNRNCTISGNILVNNSVQTTLNKNRIFQTTNKKGIMHKFYTSRGKIGPKNRNSDAMNHLENDIIMDASPGTVKIDRDDFGKPIRKGYIPVEEKIHQELKDLQSRENELKLLRKENCYSEENYDSDTQFKIEINGKIRSSKSIGEIYESLCKSNLNNNGVDSNNKTGMKSAVSLAELCDLNDEETDRSALLLNEHISGSRSSMNIIQHTDEEAGVGKCGMEVEAAQFEIASNKPRIYPLALATIFLFFSPSKMLLPKL
uniref:CSON007357 protein n=1 Tax=Culicoides sonorensis TaxID=179676 RepID=A0A336LNB1_CULSO